MKTFGSKLLELHGLLEHILSQLKNNSFSIGLRINCSVIKSGTKIGTVPFCPIPFVPGFPIIIPLDNPSHAAIKISINTTAAEFICKNIFPTPVQVKKISKK